VAEIAAQDHNVFTNHELYPILDNGCPKSADGLENIVALSYALCISIHLENLDCKPFFHCYGEEYNNAKLVFSIWELPLVDLNGVSFSLPFYVVQAPGPLLIENSILSFSEVNGPQNLLIIGTESNLTTNVTVR
jgi:hypothetical protein